MFVTLDLFDEPIHRLRRSRAQRLGGEKFLHDRAFADCLDRLADVRQGFARAYIAGWPDPRWRDELAAVVPDVIANDPATTQSLQLGAGQFDLCVSIGDLGSANDVQAAAFALRNVLRPGGYLIGAIVGGHSLPRLRAAMVAADRVDGGIAPRLHPAIDGPSLAALLVSVGFVDPVVDVDRVEVRYRSLDRLIGDLRAMACTNILTQRSRRPVTRHALAAARAEFLAGNDHTLERFDLLHFAAWVPNTDRGNRHVNPVTGRVS